MDPVDVEIRSVSKRFDDTIAVDGVSLLVERGEFVTLLGPSGCGKTTLLRLVAGFEAPDEGQILLGGQDVSALPAHRRDVHTVFQHYALFPHLTVNGNIAFGLKRKGLGKTDVTDRVANALEMVHLSGLGDRFPAQLSGGQQQRVAIARAIVLEPRVLLLDEPLGALDRKLREAMQVELKELQGRLGISFLCVTHDQDEALAMSDRVAVLNVGRIEQVGSPREIYEQPRTRFVADFVGVTNVVAGVVAEAANGHALVDAGGGRIEVPAPLEVGQRVQIAVRPEKIQFVNAEATGAIGATVEGARYLGDVTHWRVRLDDGASWTVFSRNDGSVRDFGPGDRVGLAWAPEHSIRLS
jgi:spermidine/putrescine ABC transporter ATP-binding subunit